ncbi:MAG TPA: HK97 family phage prohead protease, partial [Candidatus Sulfotelmatobacter sp.]|nr:HK97 family phage prohead protease [Candidatus Sulfotelmatobacter sp.]
YGLYAGGFLRAVSVGFVPLRWEVGAADAAFRRRYLEQELLEVSAVAIPANPEALALGLRSGAIARKDLQELVAIGARVSGATGDPSSLPAEMLLARQLREVLKGG